MNVLFAGQVPKELNFPDDIEDTYERSADDNLIVISDGASESYDSKTWAQLLARRFIGNPDLTEGWLNAAIASYTARFDIGNLSWSKQAAFGRGSFATLLAINRSAEAETVDLISVGDSLAVLLNGAEFVDSFPYRQAEEFRQRPKLLSTNVTANVFLDSPDFNLAYKKAWTLHDNWEPGILCMTDALGEWALRHQEEGNPRWQQLLEIRDTTELENLVTEERSAKRLRVDDVTLISISIAGCTKDELPDT